MQISEIKYYYETTIQDYCVSEDILTMFIRSTDTIYWIDIDQSQQLWSQHLSVIKVADNLELSDTEVANIEDEHYKYGVPLLTDLKLSDNKMV